MCEFRCENQRMLQTAVFEAAVAPPSMAEPREDALLRFIQCGLVKCVHHFKFVC